MTIKNEKADEGRKGESSPSEGVVVDNGDLWGSDMYPERRGAKIERSWFKMLIGSQGRESIDKNKCEDNVYRCVKNSKTCLIYVKGNRK